MVEVLWERHIGSVMFYLLDMAHERRQACPSVVVKEKQWSFSEKGTLIAYGGSGYGGVFTIAILKNHDQPFYNLYIKTFSRLAQERCEIWPLRARQGKPQPNDMRQLSTDTPRPKRFF